MRDMPFVEGDRLRTENGRVEIQFPDGTAIEVAENSLVEAVTPTRVRLLAGTMEHLQRPAMEAGTGRRRAADLRAVPAAGSADATASTFDRYGSWQYAAPYGYVWYPTVAAGWRPYYNGRWSAVPSYGWTWLGIDAWSWPTHHYGRWGYARNAWFWIPGRTWGAAWVSWGAAPDYVSWCPLGFDNRPVFALSVNSYDSWHRGGGGWFGWTVMSRSHFGGRGYYAHRYAVEPRSLPSDTPFIVSSRPPVGLPHQRSRQAQVAGRQPSGDGRAPAVERRPPSANDRVAAVGSRQAATERGAGGWRAARSAQFRDVNTAAASLSPGVASRRPTTRLSTAARSRARAPTMARHGRIGHRTNQPRRTTCVSRRRASAYRVARIRSRRRGPRRRRSSGFTRTPFRRQCASLTGRRAAVTDHGADVPVAWRASARRAAPAVASVVRRAAPAARRLDERRRPPPAGAPVRDSTVAARPRRPRPRRRQRPTPAGGTRRPGARARAPRSRGPAGKARRPARAARARMAASRQAIVISR